MKSCLTAYYLITKLTRDLSFLLHLFSFPYFLWVFIWYCISEQAKIIPAYSSYGWFYSNLTFWTLTILVLQLLFSLIYDFSPQIFPKSFENALNDLSSVVFCACNTVTLMYNVIRMIDVQAFGDGSSRVIWVDLSVHVYNTIVAWCDILCASSSRTFRLKSLIYVNQFSFLYSTWLLWIKLASGKFPYPFLNKFHYLYAWTTVVVIGSFIMMLFFGIGYLTTKFVRISKLHSE